MIGDKLVITDYHRAAAAKAMPAVLKCLDQGAGTIAVSVAGESGCGKSETAHCLAELVEAQGRKSLILCQDDYFKLPPKSNHNKRLEDISWVGPGEVRLDLMESNIDAIKTHPGEPLTKPLVNFDDDAIEEETITPGKVDVVIAEGTYTTLIPNLDVRVFINRNYHQTKKARMTRNRDPKTDFVEQVLEIEHQEIRQHKAKADAVIDPPQEDLAACSTCKPDLTA